MRNPLPPEGDGSGTTTSSGTVGLILFPTDSPAGPSTILIEGRLVYNFTVNNDSR